MKLETKIEIIVRLLIILILLIYLGLFLFKYFYNDNKLIIKTWFKKNEKRTPWHATEEIFVLKNWKNMQ